ncbi:DUF695 domain-containing protein [Chitinophagaceae bacterium MMS25-I14]
MIKDTVSFWNWFKNNKDKYRNIHLQDMDTINVLLDDMTGELKKFSDGLYPEIGGREEPYELIITPQGIRDYFSDAEYLVMHAPPVEGWKFFALKPPHGLGFDFKMGDMELKPESIFFKPLTDPEDEEKTGLCILHKDYQETDTERRNALIHGLYLCLDSVLGERAVTLDINFLEFATLPENLEGTGILPVSELSGYIEWRKKERKHHDVKFPPEEVAVLKGNIDGKPAIILASRQYRYYSFTEEFPYLLTTTLYFNDPREDGLPNESMESIYETEDEIVGIIGQHGHHTASKTHNGKRTIYCYIDTYEHAVSFAEKIEQSITTHKTETDILFDKYWVQMKGYM